MSTVYRALWATRNTLTSSDEVLERARKLFCSWASEGESDELADGSTIVLRANGERRIKLREVVDQGSRAVEGVTVNPTAPGGAEWTTTWRSVAVDGVIHHWIENAVDTIDIARPMQIGRPRLVEELLAMPGLHTLGTSEINTDPVTFGSERVGLLVDLLQDPGRTLPVIVFSEPSPTEPNHDSWVERAEQIIRRAGGVATVVLIGEAAVTSFKDKLGNLAVWGGGIRTYLPGPVETEDDAWRHRYLPWHLVRQRNVVDRLVDSAIQLSTRRRPPKVFSVLTQDVPTEAGQVRTEAADIEELEFQIEMYRDDVAQVEKELARAQGHLRRLERALGGADLHRVFWAAQAPSDSQRDEPDEAQDIEDAVLIAMDSLTDWIVIPEPALCELERLTTGPQAYPWGQSTLRGLRALASYARAKHDGATGSFWEWCQRGEPNGWPATTKRLSMKESESVENRSSFRKARVLPVSLEVDPTGRVYMPAHLKISEGGGELAPRVYFHDDTGGSTKKIHVGFIGPHYLMPNTRT